MAKAEYLPLRFVCAALLFGTPSTLRSQQLDLQTSLVAGNTIAEPGRPAENSSRLTPADTLLQTAEQHFQKGRRLYQAKDIERARKEFDNAIDAMLEAGPLVFDRQAFEKHLDEMVEAIHRYDLAGLGASNLDSEQLKFEKAPYEDILQMTFPVDPKLKNKVKEELQATVSQLPLELNDAVLGYIHYFSGRGHKTLVAGLERAGRYRPLIQRILDEEGVPQELIHLAQAESGFLPRALSRKAATGMWQFMAWRGRQYGLMQTPYTDDRLDAEKATRAAARHLRDLYNQFGDWYLAMAGYNCGPGTVQRAIERTGYADFWELRNRRVLPAETANYVPLILAMIIMVKNSAEYGLEAVVPAPPLEYDVVEMESPTHLALVADLTDAPISELVALNPALRKGVAPAGYFLRLPKGATTSLIASLQLIPVDRRASWRMHTVTSGETLAAIGRHYGAAPRAIAEANRLQSAHPVIGDRLVIPMAYRSRPTGIRHAGGARQAGKRVTGAKSRSRASHSIRPRKRPAVLAQTASLD